MKKIFRLAAFAAAAVALFSCTPETGDETDNGGSTLNQNLEFTLGEPEAEATEVKIRVEHNGENTDTWSYFVTTESDIDKAIVAEVKRLNESGNITLQKATKKNVTVKNLEPETDYTFVVFGLTTKGEVYGEPNSIEFTTTSETTESMTQTEDWTVSYERGEVEGQKAEVFTVECAEDLIYYMTYVDTYTLEYYMENYDMTIDDYAMYIAQYEFEMMLNYGYELSDLLVFGPSVLSFERMISDYYVAFVLGYTADGKPTGYYTAEEFEVIEEVATEDYNQWLGTWKLTSAPVSYEYDGELIEFQNSFNIEILHYDNNFKYAIGGWECGENQYLDFSNGLDGNPIYFPASYYEGMVGFEEYWITELSASESSTEAELAFGLWGICDLVVKGESYPMQYIGFEGLTMGVAEIAEDGKTGSITGLSYELPDYGIDKVTYTAMCYMGLPLVEGVNLAMWNDYMAFPITMEKVAESKSALQSMSLNINTKKMSDKIESPRLKKAAAKKPLKKF